MASLRDLPSVEKLLQAAPGLVAAYGHPLATQAIRESLDDLRSGGVQRLPTLDVQELPALILSHAENRLRAWTQSTLLSVINATGVVLHTNLGRAPLSRAAADAMSAVSLGYSTLEFDLATGKRGSRLVHAGDLLQRLTGAEAAVVVNNNAAAVLLVLSALANKRRVIIPRSQLVEIGGGFRVPDVMKQSGAKLVEIGTTNKVRLADFEDALVEANSGLVMRAHRSNFKIIGFTEEPGLVESVEMAHSFGVPFVDDLGSGALVDTARYGLAHEPTVQESLAAGVDLVCFSGDKLLGGPQAGIILGNAKLLALVKKHPLARAVRADKACLAGLSATLLHYLKDEAEREVPVLRMLAAPLDQLKARAEAWKTAAGRGEVEAAQSTVGGGSLPGESMPTWVLSLSVPSPDKFLAQLRAADPPVIARTENDKILFDPRTVLPEQDNELVRVLSQIV
jgi:L-seryl-tRNA(Ser) seleniumtransferase